MAAIQPVIVTYCAKCGLPPEFCDYNTEGPSAAGEEKKEGEGEAKKPSKGKKAVKKQIQIERAVRNKRKCVTTIRGLDLYGIKLAEAAKKFGKKFACGASVVKDAAGKEEIDIQGDFMDELIDYLAAEYKDIPEDDIKTLDKAK